MRINKFLWLCFPFFCIAFGSCVTASRVNYMQPPSNVIPAYSDTLSYTDYRLQKGDRLYIKVYSIDEKTNSLFGDDNNLQQQMQMGNTSGNFDLYTYLVYDDGTIIFPTLGRVPVRGLTTREVKKLLEEKLTIIIKEISKEHQSFSVEVKIVQRSFSVIGTGKSGRFSIPKEKITIYEALAMAGDLGEFDERGKIRIIRELEDTTLVKCFDVRSRDIINSEFYYVEPNDVIYVQRMKGHSFGINSVSSVISITATTLSFGIFIYSFINDYIIKPSKDKSSK